MKNWRVWKNKKMGKITDFKKEYIENEESEIETLEEKLTNLNKKWFKNSRIKLEIEFLENYIKQKKKLLGNLQKLEVESHANH